MPTVHVKRYLCIVVLVLATQLRLDVLVAGADGGVGHTSPSWKALSTAAVPNSRFNLLESISCPSATFCVAVGFTNPEIPEGGRYASDGDAPLIEQFDGTSWQLMKSPIASGELESVSCPSTHFCVAVGRSLGEASTNLILMDVRGDWAIRRASASAPFSSFGESLASVSCISSRFCLAVGAVVDNDVQPGQDSQLVYQEQSIQRWNGTTWAQISDPNTIWHGGLQAVSCISGPICVIDGYGDQWPGPPTTPTQSDNGALTEVLKRSSWSSAPGLVPSDLSCVSGPICVGSAGYQSFYGVFQYSSGKWSTDHLSITNPRVLGVVCESRSACTAVGSTPNAQAFISTLIGERWSGNQITHLSSQTEHELDSISCAPRRRGCVAVGDAGSLTSPSGGPAHSFSVVSS
jgi:hypothetical protein